VTIVERPAPAPCGAEPVTLHLSGATSLRQAKLEGKPPRPAALAPKAVWITPAKARGNCGMPCVPEVGHEP
jgi:hypothetical protein